MTYSVMSARFTLSLTCTTELELLFGFTRVRALVDAIGNDATMPLPSESAWRVEAVVNLDVNR